MSSFKYTVHHHLRCTTHWPRPSYANKQPDGAKQFLRLSHLTKHRTIGRCTNCSPLKKLSAVVMHSFCAKYTTINDITNYYTDIRPALALRRYVHSLLLFTDISAIKDLPSWSIQVMFWIDWRDSNTAGTSHWPIAVTPSQHWADKRLNDVIIMSSKQRAVTTVTYLFTRAHLKAVQ